MKISIDLPDVYLDEIVKREIIRKAEIEATKALERINVEKIIEDTINSMILKSKYVTDSVIRNLVQQKLAKEIAEKNIF